MNPSFKFIIALIISIEVSCKTSLSTNCLIIGAAIIYLLFAHVKWSKILTTLLLPLIAAVTIFATLDWFAPKPNLVDAFSLASRIYVYTLTTYCVMVKTAAVDLARSLEQNFHLPSKFAYGILAALNIVPRIKLAIQQIRLAAMMRGVYLSFWSPVLYFKAILVALNAAEHLSQGMASHGYREDAPRSTIVAVPVRASDWYLSGLILFFVNLTLFTLK